MSQSLSGLYNDLMCLCEIRGELSEEDNAAVEERIKEIQSKIDELEKEKHPHQGYYQNNIK